MDIERVETVVIGGGQAGLSVGYHLARRGRQCVILESSERVGDSWRRRWDSLRLFTPARLDGLAGVPFPGDPDAFPSKNEMADYLESYALKMGLPVRTGTRVEHVTRRGETYDITAGDHQLVADQVVVAMANYQLPRVPHWAEDLDPDIGQFHSSAYRNPGQLREGAVLVVGGGNSGAEIALETSSTHKTKMAGRQVGQMPFRIGGRSGRMLVRPLLRVLFHRVLTTSTPIGRHARPKIISRGGPLIRVHYRDLLGAGVELLPRLAGVRDGFPMLEDGTVVQVANVIWCTGFQPGFSWLDLEPIDDVEHAHSRGVVANEPGLYLVGQHFLYAMSSSMIHGVDRDADHVAAAICDRIATAGARVAAPDDALSDGATTV